MSPHGFHSVEWTADHRNLEITVDVPPNTFADVVVPGKARALSVDGRRARSGAGAVVRIGSTGPDRRLTLSWGRHVVEVGR